MHRASGNLYWQSLSEWRNVCVLALLVLRFGVSSCLPVSSPLTVDFLSPGSSANNPSWLSTFTASPQGITFGLCRFSLPSLCPSKSFHLSPSALGVGRFMNWGENSWEKVVEAQLLCWPLSLSVSPVVPLLLSIFPPLYFHASNSFLPFILFLSLCHLL